MGAEPERQRVRADVGRPRVHGEAVLAQAVGDRQLERVRVALGGEQHERQRDGVVAVVDQLPAAVAHEPVQGVLVAHVVDGQLLLGALERVLSVVDATRPRREDLTHPVAGHLVRAEGVQQLDAGDLERAQRGAHLGDDGLVVAVLDLVGRARGRERVRRRP